jgi:serine/threonine protein kinase
LSGRIILHSNSRQNLTVGAGIVWWLRGSAAPIVGGMATNLAAMQLSPAATTFLGAADPFFLDSDVTLPTRSHTGWTCEQWLDALANGECDCETVIRGVRESIVEDPDACWELLGLVDQYFRRHRIKEEHFRNLNALALAFLNKSPPSIETPAPKPAPDRAAQTHAEHAAPMPTAVPPAGKRDLAANDVLRKRYRIDGILGRGGMGIVYAATDLCRPGYIPSDQRIALKVLHSEVVQRPGLLSELRGEFQCLQSLSHPNIVRVHEFDQDGDISFFTMEQLSGSPLNRVIAERGPKPLYRPYALAIIQQAGAAVAYAHSRGIVHGDLNPANIFITEWGEIRVLDFGSANRTSRGPSTQASNAIGLRASVATPSYASCGQLEGRDPTTEDDVYAMACVSYVLLTGRHPFQGLNSLAARQAHRRPRRPDDISAGQWRALKAGLSFNPKDRPADLQTWLDRLGLPPGAPQLPALATIMTERPQSKRVGPPVVTALIALAAAVCWWAQAQYGWLDNPAIGSALKAAQAAVQPIISRTPLSAARSAPVSVPAPVPHVVSNPVPAPEVLAPGSDSPERPVEPRAPESSPVGVPTAAQPSGASQETARIELAANTIEVDPTQPAASVVVSRRHNYQRGVSFTWSTESGTAKPGQDFMPVTSRTEYIAAGAPQTRLLVPIVENPRRHLSKTFYVVVNTPGEGATLGARTITQVTIPASD